MSETRRLHKAHDFPNSVPEPHRRFIVDIVERLSADTRFVGLAIGGSYLTDSMDEFSDLDLVCAVESTDYAKVLADRQDIAASVGSLLSGFTGEHVGEPRLLICLYDDPLMHVDYKFVDIADVAKRVEDPVVLFDRDGRMTAALRSGAAEFPKSDPQWIEDRFWVWVHYGAVKIGRGEMFEAISFLDYLRGTVFGPLILAGTAARPERVRRLEHAAPEYIEQLKATLASYDAADCFRALWSAVKLYRQLRPVDGQIEWKSAAEEAAVKYAQKLEVRLTS